MLTLDHLTFHYPQHPLFTNETVTIPAGSFTGIIGPNGGGKTTLMRLLLGFLQPQGGNVRIDGEEPNPAAQKIAYIPQLWKVDRSFPISALELVLMGRLEYLPWYGRFRAKDRRIAEEAMERVRVSSCALQPLEELSGGQVQRVLIARALASEPRILFLDEPTASIDSDAERDIYALLDELRKEGVTILMVTHDLQTAIHHVDRVLCVQNGIISMDPQEVCKHYAIGLYHNPLLGEPR